MGIDWATLTTVAVSVLTVIGAVIWRACKITWWLGDRLDAITQATTKALIEHEEKDQRRHVEVVERIAKIEAKIE